MKFTNKHGYFVNSTLVWLSSRRMSDYDMYSMQLFIKVDEAASDGPSCMTSPKFYVVTTSCEFSLVQALENILGGDLVHYEIVGPGPWVMWTTLAKELKGQQLTLLYHSQPVPHTRAALYGTTEKDTELKKPATAKNIPTSIDITHGDETHVKVLDFTQIESLKCSPKSSAPTTNSNNETQFDSLENQSMVFESMPAEGPTKANTCTSLDSHDFNFTIDSQTHTKVLMTNNNIIPEYTQVVNIFPNKLRCDENINMNDNHDMEAEQILNNVPHFSILESSVSAISSNVHISTLQATQNHSLPIAENPHLQTSEKLSLQNVHEKTQIKLNNLNCVTLTSSPHSSYVQNSLDSQIVQGNTDSNTPASETVVKSWSLLSQEENSVDNVRNVDDSPIQSTGISEVNVATFNTNFAASSLFAHQGQIQHVDVSKCTQSVDYIPHTCIQVGGQIPNSDHLVNPSDCQISGFALTPPQKRHRLDGIISSPLASAEQQIQHHHQLQQQALLHQQALELKQLQELQHQRAQTSAQIAASHIGYSSAINLQNHHQEQQLQNRLCTVPQASAPQHLQTTSFKQSSSSEQGQNSRHQNGETNSQSLQQPCFSQQIFHHHPRLNQPQHSCCGTQSLDQPLIIQRAPPQRLPDEETQNTFPQMSEAEQKQLKEPQFFPPLLGQQRFALLQSPEQASQLINANFRTEEYMTMIKPPQAGIGNSSGRPPFLGSQRMDSPGQPTHPTPTMLPNYEFTVRLPQPELNTSFKVPQACVIPRNHSRNTSGSSSRDSSAGSGSAFTHSGAILFQRGEKGQLMTSAPCQATLSSKGLQSSHIQASAANRNGASRSSDSTSMDEEGYNSIDNSHFPRGGHSQPVSQWPCPATPKRAGLSLETELLYMEGWCQNENGDTIQNTMEKFRSQDGSFIVWKSRRYNKFVFSVSHLNQLFHFRVEETKHETKDRTVYYLFEGGFRSESLLDLLQHYRQNSVRITVRSHDGLKTYMEHIQLRYPIRSEIKRKDTSKST